MLKDQNVFRYGMSWLLVAGKVATPPVILWLATRSDSGFVNAVTPLITAIAKTLR